MKLKFGGTVQGYTRFGVPHCVAKQGTVCCDTTETRGFS